jgi:hypothetical protein
MERINKAIDVDEIRRELRIKKVRARVQTYRNHDDISIMPVAGNWSEQDIAAVRETIAGLKLVDVYVRTCGREMPDDLNRRRGFRYLRPV